MRRPKPDRGSAETDEPQAALSAGVSIINSRIHDRWARLNPNPRLAASMRSRRASRGNSAIGRRYPLEPYPWPVTPRVLHLSTYEAKGGAARAARTLHRALLAQGAQSRMHVGTRQTTDPAVSQGSAARQAVSRELDRRLWQLQRSPTQTWRSPARFASLSPEVVNRSSADIVNLHWVTDGFLSVEAIARIDKPIVWSMYDMWPFCGTEHYALDTPTARWRTGYTNTNRPKDESGFDLDRWTYKRKRAHWLGRPPIHMVPASTWLHDATKASALLGGSPVHRIPHVIDVDTFAPLEMTDARRRLGLPLEVPIILFLASAGITDKRKGWDLLEAALPAVKQTQVNLLVVVVGPIPHDDARSRTERACAATVHWHGPVDSSAELRLLYTAANITAVPSREDNMPLTAMEAQACGRAVVGFQIGGLLDIVSPESGILCPPFDVDILADALAGALDDAQAQGTQGQHARRRALDLWSPAAVVPQYLHVYEMARG